MRRRGAGVEGSLVARWRLKFGVVLVDVPDFGFDWEEARGSFGGHAFLHELRPASAEVGDDSADGLSKH